MRQIETPLLEIKVLDDDAIRARRKDRKPLTQADREEARRIAAKLPGVTIDDVLLVFPGARVVSKTPRKPAENPQLQFELVQGGKR